MEQLDSPQLRAAARRYAQAAQRLSAVPFWRRTSAESKLRAQRREYVGELIRTAETHRLRV